MNRRLNRNVFSCRARDGCSAAALAAALPLAMPASAQVRAAVGATPSDAAELLTPAPPAVFAVIRTTVTDAREEAFTTSPGQIREIMFADGSSLTLGPSSRLVIQRYTWNGSTRTGEAVLALERGTLRVIGGALNRALPIRVQSGEVVLNLANGGFFVTAEPDRLRAALLFGGTLAVNLRGRSEVIQRPGYEIEIVGNRLSAPRRQAPGRAFADAAMVNPRLAGRARTAPVSTREGASEERVDEGALTRSQVVSYDVPVPDFGNNAVQVAARGDIDLGLPATGTVAANGNASTGDSADDILVAQGSIIRNYGDIRERGRRFGGGAFAGRDFAPTVRRLLPASGFDFATDGLAVVPTYGNAGTGYVFSSGLNDLFPLDNDDPLFAPVRVEPTFDAVVVPTTITFDNTTFETSDNGLTYLDSAGREILRLATGYAIVSPRPPRERYTLQPALVLTDGVDIRVGEADPELGISSPPTGYNSNTLILPLGVVGQDGAISPPSMVNGKIAARALTSLDQDEVDAAAPSGGYSSYDAAVNAAIALADSKTFIDLVESSPDSGTTGFDYGSTYSVTTLQSGFRQGAGVQDADGRALDNFLFLQVEDPHGRSLVFATGDVGKERSGAASIDSFGIARGLTEADAAQLTGAPSPSMGFRAFLPAISVGAVPLGSVVQTGLLVANPPGSTGASTSRMFHADLGLGPDGTASTVSATFGTISYNATAYNPRVPIYDDDPHAAADDIDPVDPRATVGASGLTIGSTREGNRAAVLFESPLAATASGGGRTWQTQPSSGTRPGYVGYMVLENAADTAGGVVAGTSTPLGGGAGSSFGTLRLAAGYASRPDSDMIDGAASGRYLGYVAGALEQEGASLTVAVRPFLGTVDLSLDPVANTASASIAYDDGAPRVLSLGARPVGGPVGRADEASAYIDMARYGAAVNSGGAHAALIAGEGVKAGLRTAAVAKVPTYQHLQWGFFFGDLAPTVSGAESRRNHAALATWVAGTPYQGASCATVGGSVDCGIRGSASYSGHAIGSVLREGGAIASVVGSFTQSWNLDSRTGSMQLDFDGSAYRTPLAITGTQRLTYGGASALVGDRQARVDGELVDVRRQTIGGVTDAAPRPGGSIGQFQVRDLAGAYQANGTFGGDIVR